MNSCFTNHRISCDGVQILPIQCETIFLRARHSSHLARASRTAPSNSPKRPREPFTQLSLETECPGVIAMAHKSCCSLRSGVSPALARQRGFSLSPAERMWRALARFRRHRLVRVWAMIENLILIADIEQLAASLAPLAIKGAPRDWKRRERRELGLSHMYGFVHNARKVGTASHIYRAQ